MSVWEQLQSLHSKQVIRFCVVALMSITLLACYDTGSGNSANKDGSNSAPSKQTASDSANNQQDKTIPKEAVALKQTDLENIEALLEQLKRAGKAEEKASAILLKDAKELSAKGQWGAAVKAYGEAALYKPSSEALTGYATAKVMVDRVRSGKKESLDAKLRDFQGAVKTYRITIDLGERSGTPLSAEQRKDIEDKISCLENFSKNSDTAKPGCQLVTDALKVSKIILSNGLKIK